MSDPLSATDDRRCISFTNKEHRFFVASHIGCDNNKSRDVPSFIFSMSGSRWEISPIEKALEIKLYGVSVWLEASNERKKKVRGGRRRKRRMRSIVGLWT
ncbi:hypothetical protein PoB_002527700 [Plakobranchus ocellatus]|uniref:Uncharacterized protein n=1 Tax=Plakobranchus ocellatus TaxID=259542 RepID=A0AAV3ZVT6_9GAST|nr:hypothetical protein PoB_002527700 [Plakobranchus ocellatus]